MMLTVMLFLALAGNPPANPEDAGAKAMFGDPSLNLIVISPRPGERFRNGFQSEGKERNEAGKNRVDSPHPKPTGESGRLTSLPPAEEPRRSIGIRFWIRQVNDQGKILAEIGVGHVFRSSQRIQLVVESNTEGYLAIVQEGSDGRSGLLFPAQESELGTSRIPAHSKIILPSGTQSFTFDQTAGTERLLIILARDRQEFARLPLRREMGPADLAELRRLAEKEIGSKNLLIESFSDPAGDPATYTVNRVGSAIVQEIALMHER